MNLSDLERRLEAAAGPDRKLDGMIWWSLERASAERCYHNHAIGFPEAIPPYFTLDDLPSGIGRLSVKEMAPKFTASLDTALALVGRVLPEWQRETLWNSCQGHLAALTDNADQNSSGYIYSATGPNAAVALCLALVRALQQKKDDDQ